MTFSNSEVSGEQTRQYCLDFAIYDDDILEDVETFQLHIALQQSNDVPVTILPHTTSVTILDDDSESESDRLSVVHYVLVGTCVYKVDDVIPNTSLSLSPAVTIEPDRRPQILSESNTRSHLCVNILGGRQTDFTYFYTLSPDTAQGKGTMLGDPWYGLV